MGSPHLGQRGVDMFPLGFHGMSLDSQPWIAIAMLFLIQRQITYRISGVAKPLADAERLVAKIQNNI
jgi:hypothetical protein